MTTLAGHCHCGAIRVELDPGRPVDELPLRSCQCGFCRRHGARTMSDPASRLHIEAAPGVLNRYRFGARAVDALLCEECGVYVASVLQTDDGRLLATLNVAGVDLEGFGGRTAEPVSYEHETQDERLERRMARWTPAVLVEALPSA
ncbi:GFA family protein [Phenylobacterium koreense]|uniref:CENP-V/GFA domain-containing protein n=1 Tax=Phenylobacterium koreense TaxID=266125 RepID=A0ABV2EKH0_9CAUL